MAGPGMPVEGEVEEGGKDRRRWPLYSRLNEDYYRNGGVIMQTKKTNARLRRCNRPRIELLMGEEMEMKTSLHFESTSQRLPSRLYCVLPWLLLALCRAHDSDIASGSTHKVGGRFEKLRPVISRCLPGNRGRLF